MVPKKHYFLLSYGSPRCIMATLVEANPAKCIIREITDFLMNILASFLFSHYFLHLILIHDDIFHFCNQKIHSSSWFLRGFMNLLRLIPTKQHSFKNIQSNFWWKLPILKLSAWNNCWTKKEAKIFIRKSVISQIIHWLD